MKRLLKWIFSVRGLITVLFVLFVVVPIMESWRMGKLRDDAISALEKKRGSRVIVLIHRQESVNVLGIPVVRYINIDDSEAILRAIRFTDKNTPIDFILHSRRPGPRRIADRQGDQTPSCQDHRFCPALCHVGRNPHRTGGERDRHGHERRARSH